jgi:hypothetical protein
MSIGNYFLILAGSLICWFQFRKRTEDPKRVLRVWSGAEGTLIDEEAGKRCNDARAQIKAMRSLFSVLMVILFAAVINWEFNYVQGPILLAVSSILLSIPILNSAESKLNLEFKYVKDIEQRSRILDQIRDARINTAKFLVPVLLLSSFWGYRIQVDGSEQREAAINEVLELTGTGWCSEWWDIDASGGVDNIVKTGGWPCIYIKSVSNIVFTKKADYSNICFDYVLNRSNGIPTNDFFIDFDYDNVCSTDSWFIEDGGWSASVFQDKIREKIGSSLENFRLEACNKYYFRLSDEEKTVYC